MEPGALQARGAQLTQIHQRPSPNFGVRRDAGKPSLIVLHYTAMQSAEAACDWLCNPAAEVSAHYLISRTGDVTQMVAEDMRAWHAGAGSWGGIADINSSSIGIELDNDGLSPFPEPLMAALEALLPGIMARWGISAQSVIGHSDMAPGRKIDPGARFDWQRLACQNLSVWPKVKTELPVDAGRFSADLAAFGMTAQVGADTQLIAFRSRFRPGREGPLDAVDMAIAADLARRFPVDVDKANA